MEKGDPIQLTCNATGNDYSPGDIDWFKDGQRVVVDSQKGINISKRNFETTRSVSSELKIESAQMDDAGTYVCRISDKLITSSKIMVLNGEFTTKHMLYKHYFIRE